MINVGTLKIFPACRMDNAQLESVDLAMKAAKSAVMLDMPTDEIEETFQPEEPLYGMAGIITTAGGLPVRNRAGELLGAVGVSGSTVENNYSVA